MSDLHALLVGIDHYDPDRLADGSRISHLQACANDVERMEEFLRAEPVALPPERLRKLVSPSPWPGRPRPAAEDLPTYRNLVRELESLCQRTAEGDQVLIHYSGHGGRLPTAALEKKGPWAKDECLVPCDAGAPDGGFLRDLEVYEILRRLAERGVQVTLILDCCHSGGITRELGPLPGGNVRSLGEVHAPAPAESLLGSWEELAAGLPEDPGGPEAGGGSGPATGVFRNLHTQSGWFPQPEGCVLFAACRPTELAREYAFDGGAWSGALTHFLLQAVGDLDTRPTYRRLHHRLLGRIRSLFDTQTPLLEGDGDLRFLGRETWPARRGIGVLAVEGEGSERRVQIAAGRAQGLGKKARLAVAAREGGGDGDGEGDREPGAELEVETLGATTSWARIVGTVSKGPPVEPGDLATVSDPGKGARKYPIRVLRPEGGAEDRPDGGETGRGAGPASGRAPGPAPGQQEPLERLREALESGDHPLLSLTPEEASQGAGEAEDGAEASGAGDLEYQVEITPSGAFQILDPSGEPIPHQGQAIPATDPDAVNRLMARLSHLASYRERARLDNPSTGSPLAGKLRLELYRIEDIEDWQDPDERERVPEGATVPEGTLLCLLVGNDSSRELNVAVLDLQPDWGITQVHPGPGEGHYTVLEPDQEHPVFLKAGLPDWIEEGRDQLKVIATTGPLDATTLELDPLGQSTGYRSLRSPGEPRELRDQLFTRSRTGYRNTAALTPASHEWAVETVELSVIRVAGTVKDVKMAVAARRA